jgi:hypothetical protein
VMDEGMIYPDTVYMFKKNFTRIRHFFILFFLIGSAVSPRGTTNLQYACGEKWSELESKPFSDPAPYEIILRLLTYSLKKKEKKEKKK